jgi:ABC-type amino acid transport substrate-binding protein
MDLRRLREQLESGLFDMTTSVAVTPNRSRQVGFATHSDFTVSLVVRDFRREAFATVASIREMKGLRIAVPRVRYYQKMLERWFPEAEVILIDSEREFFDAEPGEIDAMLHAAEVGAAWTLLYPDYSVVVPEPIHVKAPLGFVFARGELEFGRFLESWLDLNRKNGGLEALYRYWILGRDDAAHQPRWSVIRDVLHWVE